VCAVLLQEAGVQLRIGRTIAGVEGEERPTAVLLDDGARVTFDAIVVAVGAVPNVEWLEGAGIALADGVVCDASLAVIGAGPIVAAGDVARWPNPATGGAPMRIEHWSNAVEQGAAAARTLLVGPGPGTAHSATPSFWSDHLGVRLQSIGTLNGATRFEVIAGAPGERRFAATAYDTRDRLLGAVAYDMPREISRCRAALADHRAAVG
jgi:NADPH-dependent 2,4-dienoyl-CoA reductase/sulfur reductase-like enzyme